MTIRTIDLATGEETTRDYTQEELDAIASAPGPIPPTPQQQIRALEAQYADAQDGNHV